MNESIVSREASPQRLSSNEGWSIMAVWLAVGLSHRVHERRFRG